MVLLNLIKEERRVDPAIFLFMEPARNWMQYDKICCDLLGSTVCIFLLLRFKQERHSKKLSNQNTSQLLLALYHISKRLTGICGLWATHGTHYLNKGPD
jgi:hypothetical protein